MTRGGFLALTVAAGLFVGCAISAASAAARPAVPTGSGVSAVNQTTPYIAGYTFPVSGTSASVTAEFVVPNVTNCNANSTPEPSVGPGVFLWTQAGPGGVPAVAAQVQLDCLNHKYYRLADIGFGSNIKFGHAAAVGDLIKVTVTLNATASTGTVRDLTSGHAFTFTQSGPGGTPAQAGVADHLQGQFGSTTQDPIAEFGSLHFKAAAVDGKALGAVPGATAYNMVSSANVLQIVTGPLTGGTSAAAHNGFTTTWKHS